MSITKTAHEDHLNDSDGRFVDDHYDALLAEASRTPMTRPVLPVECEATPSLWRRAVDTIEQNGFTRRPHATQLPVWSEFHGRGHVVKLASESATRLVIRVVDTEGDVGPALHIVEDVDRVLQIVRSIWEFDCERTGIGSPDRVREVA